MFGRLSFFTSPIKFLRYLQNIFAPAPMNGTEFVDVRSGEVQITAPVITSAADDPSVPQSVFTITEKAPTRAFSRLKAATTASGAFYMDCTTSPINRFQLCNHSCTLGPAQPQQTCLSFYSSPTPPTCAQIIETSSTKLGTFRVYIYKKLL